MAKDEYRRTGQITYKAVATESVQEVVLWAERREREEVLARMAQDRAADLATANAERWVRMSRCSPGTLKSSSVGVPGFRNTRTDIRPLYIYPPEPIPEPSDSVPTGPRISKDEVIMTVFATAEVEGTVDCVEISRPGSTRSS